MNRITVQLPQRLTHIAERSFLYFRLVARRFVEDGCQHSAAALTYMTLFALVPLLTVLFTVLSLVPSFDSLNQQVELFIVENMVPSASNELFNYLEEFAAQARLLSLPGIAMLVVTAYLMLVNIEKVFNRIWDAPGRRTGINSFLVYWAVLSLGPLLLGAGLMINTYLLSLQVLGEGQMVSDIFHYLLEYTPWLTTAVAFMLLYKAVPNCEVLLKNAFVGGVVATIAFELAKNGFGLIVSNSSFRNVYGAFSAVPLFLLWTYLCWMIILAGAEFVRATETYASEVGGRRYETSRALLMVLWYFYRAQRKGLTLSDARVVAVGLDADQWRFLRDRLLANRVITVTQKGNYVLARNLHQTTLWDLLQLIDDSLAESPQEPSQRILEHHPWMNRYDALISEVHSKAGESLNIPVAQLFEEAEEEGSDATV